MAAANEMSFSINILGEVTQERWVGTFTAKCRLSHRDHLTADKLFRELIGPNPETACDRARQTSEIFSQLAVRIVQSPDWWKASGNGADLADDAIIAEVYNNAMRIEKEALETLKKKAAEAQAELQKQAPATP